MQTLIKLMRKVIDNVNEACNHSITSTDIERAAEHIDNYIDEIWQELAEEDPVWSVIREAFVNTNADEKDDAVTFISYIILTQCMLKDKNK